MLVRVFAESAFGLRGGIPMEGDRTNVYHAHASRADITRSTRTRISNNEPPTRQEARGADAYICLFQRCESALDAQR